MSNECPKGQRQRLDLPGRCSDKCIIGIACDLPAVMPVTEVSIEDLVDAKFSGKDITNPEFLNDARKAKACDRFIKDITND